MIGTKEKFKLFLMTKYDMTYSKYSSLSIERKKEIQAEYTGHKADRGKKK